MTETNLKRYVVYFMIPYASMQEWEKTDAKTKELDEKKMMEEWQAWSEAHANMIIKHYIAGKTKLITLGKVTEHKNDIGVYSYVQGESHDAIAKEYTNHPHLQIPGSTIEIMEVMDM
ncbi:MAG: hypothetical protein QM538_05770 [Methylacidiphilales bacterium]|nr:hypothetical protein [Candidatus Methylacidiphilales bacterium]